MKKTIGNGWPGARAWAAALLVAGTATMGEGRADVTNFGASDDNLIYNGSAAFRDANWGEWGTRQIAVGENSTSFSNATYRSLIRFDIGALDGQFASIDSATLTLTLAYTNKVTADVDVRLFLLDSLNSGWVEGTKSATTAGLGESCWNYLAYSNTPWVGGPGIGNSSDSAGIGELLDTVTVQTNGLALNTQYTFMIDSVGGLAALTSWATGGANAGFLLATPETYGFQNAPYFWSSEATTLAYRPELSLTYTIPEPSTFALMGLGAVALLGLARRRKITG